jgi:hypothetical protein
VARISARPKPFPTLDVRCGALPWRSSDARAPSGISRKAPVSNLSFLYMSPGTKESNKEFLGTQLQSSHVSCGMYHLILTLHHESSTWLTVTNDIHHALLFPTTKGPSSRSVLQHVVQSLTAPTLLRCTHFRILFPKLLLSHPPWIVFVSNIRCKARILVITFIESSLLQVLPFWPMCIYILAVDIGRCNSSMACGTASLEGAGCISYRCGL